MKETRKKYSKEYKQKAAELSNVRIFDKDGQYYAREIGKKQYELVDHLGNVRTVFTDEKQRSGKVGDNMGEYDVEAVAIMDYYPGGMQMPGRTYSDGGYRYSFKN